MKKIMAFLLALMVSTTVIANSFKANAIAAPVSLLTYLIQACTEMLVGSGVYTQSQVNDMSTSDIFSNTKSVVPSIDWEKNAQMKVNTINNINKFLNDAVKNHNKINASPSMPSADLLSQATTKVLVDFINGHVPDLPTVNPELKGYGAMGVVQIYRKSDNTLDNTAVYFGDYGIIDKGVLANIYGDKIIRQYIFGTNQTEKEYSGVLTLGGAFGEDNYILPKVKFIGDWRYPDGTTATDMLTFVQEVPEAIGTVDIDGTTYDVNGDGTVSIDDNTIPINDDSSVTVDGNPYYPDYDISPYPGTSIGDLITTIINNIDVVDETPTDDADKVLDDALIDAPEIANTQFSSLLVPKTISTVFPFCIPRDFYIGIKMLSEEPEAPKFEVPFEIPEYGSFPGVKKMIVIDFSEYSSAFAVVRWVNYMLFMFAICFITFKIVKGV